MGKKSEPPQTGAFHESVEGQIHKGTDNKISYAHNDNQSSNKVLFLLFKDTTSGHREINGREQHDTFISKNQWLKRTYSMEVHGGDKKIRFIQDQVRSMSQRHLEWSTRDQQGDNKLESTSDEETCLKVFLGNDDFDECGDEKGDEEKEVPISTVEECEWSFDAESLEVSLKEDMEESEKINNSGGSVCFSDDSQYVSATSFELGERVTDISDDEIAVRDVSLKEEYELSEKFINSLSSLFSSFGSKYSSDESQQCSKKIDVDTKVSDQRHGYCLTNELSYAGQLMTRFEYSALKHDECIDWNIGMSSLETMGTSSFNGYNNCEDKQCLAAANMLYNNDYNKEMTKKSPLSMDNRHSAPTALKPEDADFVGSSTLTHSTERPRERSGSHGKSRGRRQRSRKHGNNKGGGRVGGAGNSGGGGCPTSDNGTNSLDGGGSGDNGDGNGNEDDWKKEKNTHKLPDEAEDNDDEDDDDDDGDDSDDDNKKGSGEKEVGAMGNLLPVVSTARDKTMDKDLTSLTMGYPPPPGQSVKYEGLSSWQRESESFSIVSMVPQQEEGAPVMMDHSCISQDSVCYIIGAASGEDYLPRDDVFLPLNPCFTTLTHNMSLAFDGLDCVHCCILSRLLQHVGRCETSLPCDVCLQGYNMVLHHAKICIEKKRPWSPFNRMDLCFKLCQSVRWNPEELFGPKKLYNQMMVKKYCSKILTKPFDQEVSSIDKTLHCVNDEVCVPTDDLEVLGQSDDSRKCDSATSAVIEKSSEGHGGGALKSKVGDEDAKVPRPVKSSGGQSHHASLSRKPSNSRRNHIPPSIEEDEEDEEKEKDDEATTEESAEAILRRKYGPTDGATAAAASGFSEREFIYSLPQGRINDQTQFISLVSQAKGVKGVGEVVYSNVAQLRLVANFWGQKKDEFKSTGKRPYQRAEEGVILEKHKTKFKILGTRYQLDYQWHKLTSLGSGMTGRCYLAMDEETGFRFCVKKIYLVDYKKEELCLWSDLDHPNIVKVYGALRHSEFIYVFIEYIDGGDLAHCIDEHKSRGERVSHWLAVKYFQQLLTALVYLESKSLLHEDIKADNLLLRAGDFQILLTDFGLCHRLQKPVELKDKTPAGTVTHFSPEKAASMGHGFPACVWACVCVLVHMLSGHQPWTKYLKKVDYLNFTIYMKPPPLDDVPDNIRAIVKDLIAQGFTKEAENRPNARQLLQHEAFNIINQETETYFSTLASGFQSNAGFASRALRDRNTSVRDSGAVARGTQAPPQEQEVSLFEISVPQNAEMRHLSNVVQMTGADAREENEQFSQLPKTFNTEERQEDDDGGSEEQLEGAVGGDVAQSVEKEDAQRTNIPAILNQLISSSEDHGAEADETSDDVQYSDEVRDLLDPRIPLLEMLLHSSEESTVSFLTDRTSQNWNVGVQGESNLEVFNPNTSVTPRSDGSGQGELPILSIFDQFLWDKHNPSAIDRQQQQHLSGNSSSGDIDSAELFAPGKEDVPTHFTEKKPADLKLNVIRGQQQQQQQEKRSSSLSRSSCSTANIATASSQGSSVFYPGTASASAVGQDFKDFFNQKQDDVDSEEDNEEDENKTKVSLVLANLRERINEDNLDGLKLTIHNGKREKLFSYRVSERDRQLPVNQHISAFKAKIGHRHFELKTMEGEEINYNSRLKVTQLMVVAPPDTNQCWCAGCQF